MNLTPTRLLTVTLALLTAPVVLTAQTAPASDKSASPAPTAAEVKKTSSADSAEEPAQLEQYEVTGSRIRTLNGEVTALPTVTFSQVELEQRGVSRLADIRWAIPQLGPSTGFNDNMQNSGTSRAQTVSTSFALRGVSGNSTLVLIDGRRIPHTGQEAPGGAGGREDFNFDGIPVSAIERIEVLPQGAGAIYGSDAITGVVNIILKKNYVGTDVQYSYDNAFRGDVATKTATITSGYRAGKLSTFLTLSQTDQNGLNGSERWWTKSNNTQPYGASYNNLIYSASGGAGTLASGYYPASSTTVYGIPAGSKGAFTTTQAAAATVPGLYDSAPYVQLVNPARSQSLVFKADYDYSAWLKPYLQVRYNDATTYTTGAPVSLITQLAAGANGNPFSTPMYLAKVFYDIPAPSTVSEQKNEGLTFGVAGDLPANWRYDAGFSWARNIVSDVGTNTGIDYTALASAISRGVLLTYDSAVPGSDPNAAGLVQSIFANSSHKDTTDVYEYSVQADGPVWTNWAGDVKAAVGAEAQKEKVNFSRTPAISYVLSKPFERTVDAGFAELSIPLLSDRQGIPLVHRVEVSGAGRIEHFSDLGQHITPSVNALYQPVKWLTFRVARTEGFKAPKLYDLLAPNYATTTTITSSRGIVDTQRNNAPVVGTYNLVTGGQPNLKPEKSVSRDAGVVLDVPGVKGLSLSVDFWDLDYKDQISAPGYQDLITFFPSRVTRDANGVITGFDTSNINQSKVKLHGVDYRISYQRRFGFGDVLLSTGISDSSTLVAIATPSSKPTSRYMPLRGSASLFWANGPWGAGVSVNYQSHFQLYSGSATYYPSYIEWNPQVSYDFSQNSVFTNRDSAFALRLLNGCKLTVTVVNAFDKQPDTTTVGLTSTVIDPRLSRYILTLSKKF